MNIVDLSAKKADLECLKKAIGSSRVVALGECAHFVREFWELRQHLFEYLHEKCGFNFFAMEFGFAEGYRLEKWIKGEGDKTKLSDYSEAAAKWGASETMLWLREYNNTNKNKIRFAGIDIPEAGGTIIPALSPLQDYIKKADNSLEAKLNEIIEIANNFSDLSSLKSIVKWKNISTEKQHKLFAELNKMRLRFEAMENDYVQLSSQEEYDAAFRLLETAAVTVYMLQSCVEMSSGTGLPYDMSIREKFMADSVLWHLNHSEPDARIAVFAHNNHIQKTPVQYGEYKYVYPMGSYLNKYLGKDYAAFALTTTDDHIPEMVLTDASPVGFNVVDKEIGLPAKGSIENFLTENGYKDKPAFINFQTEEKEIHCFRSQSAYISTSSIKETFNGVFSIPKIWVMGTEELTQNKIFNKTE
ncbi:MAG: erythromycin esterase family protein [Endomicrobia bacterium]|nr:erythromycin esterase family protein [Endomicrobiia bacterium]